MATSGPHDALFKAAMGDPGRAADLLRLVMPKAVFGELDPATLQVESGSYISEELREEQSDLLLSARCSGRELLVYVLFEHKSFVDPWVFFQMLGYMHAVWAQQRAADPAAPLSPILPILISHADGGWTGPRRFAGLFGTSLAGAGALDPFVPDFEVVIEDLHERDDAEEFQPGSHVVRNELGEEFQPGSHVVRNELGGRPRGGP